MAFSRMLRSARMTSDVAISRLRRRRVDVTLQPHALGGGHRRHPRDRIRDQILEGDLLELAVEHAGLRPTQLEQVVDETTQSVGFLPQDAVVADDVVLARDEAVLERLDDGADPGERGPEVVGDPRHELSPGRVERLLPSSSLVEARPCQIELAVQARELLGSGRIGLAPRHGSVAETPRHLDELVTGGSDTTTEEEGAHHADGARNAEDDGQRAEVVLGEEHRPGGHPGADPDRGHRRHGDGSALDAEAAPAEEAEHEGAGDHRRGRGRDRGSARSNPSRMVDLRRHGTRTGTPRPRPSRCESAPTGRLRPSRGGVGCAP